MPDSYDAFPPCGLDWADGLDIRPGTPTADAAVLVLPDFRDLGMFEEYPNSPEIERGEQCTVRHSFKVDWESGLLIVSAIGRGTIVTDSRGYLFRVLTVQLNRTKPNTADLIITSESLSFDNPPDEFSADDVEINPEVEKHPRFFDIAGNGLDINPYNLDNNGQVIVQGVITGPQIIQLCKQAADAVSVAGGNESLHQISAGIPAGDLDIEELALDELYPRYLRGETTFYLAGMKVIWASYYWLPPLVDLGGYIQDPVTQGGLPPYFWSSTQDENGENILDTLSKENNPIIYGNGISWLRVADRIDFSRTWFKLTRTWLGGPLGHWDKFLYPDYTPS